MHPFSDLIAKTPRRAALVAFLAGLLMSLGLAPFGLSFIQFLCIPILGWLCVYALTARAAMWAGFWGGFGYFLGAFNWLVEPFFVDAARHAWMAPFGIGFMAAGLALFWAAAFYGVARLPVLPSRRFLMLAAIWVLAEYIRSVLFTGLPWGQFSQAWVGTPLAQLGAILGMHGTTLVILILALRPLMDVENLWRRAVTSLVVLGAIFVFGWLRVPNVERMAYTDKYIRLVQPNAPQHLKWRDDKIVDFYRRHLTLMAQPAAKQLDAIILSETAMPFFLGENPGALEQLSQAAGSAQVIFGIRRFDLEGNIYNTLGHIDEFGGILAEYDKHHLVPFGEYIPVLRHIDALGIAGMVGRGYSAGNGPRLVEDRFLPPYLPLICYEAIFPQDLRLRGQRPEWLIHATNDAWFGNFSGPYQHLAQARMRAIEQGLPMARAANTGVTAMIDPYGRLLQYLPLNRTGVVDAQLPAARKKTIYVWVGDAPWMLFVFLSLFFSLVPIGRVLPKDG